MKATQPPRVLIVVGDASETVDTLYPFYRLQEAGFTPVIAAPELRTYQMVMHEVRPGWTITREWEGYQIQADVAFADVDPASYVGIFFSGGRAPEYLRYDEDLVRITRHVEHLRRVQRYMLLERLIEPAFPHVGTNSHSQLSSFLCALAKFAHDRFRGAWRCLAFVCCSKT